MDTDPKHTIKPRSFLRQRIFCSGQVSHLISTRASMHFTSLHACILCPAVKLVFILSRKTIRDTHYYSKQTVKRCLEGIFKDFLTAAGIKVVIFQRRLTGLQKCALLLIQYDLKPFICVPSSAEASTSSCVIL